MSKIRIKYKSITVISFIILIIMITGTVFKGNIYKLSGDAYTVLGKDEMVSVYYERAIKNDYGSDIAIKASLEKMKNITDKKHITFMSGVSIGRSGQVVHALNILSAIYTDGYRLRDEDVFDQWKDAYGRDVKRAKEVTEQLYSIVGDKSVVLLRLQRIYKDYREYI